MVLIVDLPKKLVKMKIPGLVLRYSDSIELRSAQESEFLLKTSQGILKHKVLRTHFENRL